MKKLRFLTVALLLAAVIMPFAVGYTTTKVEAYSLVNGEKVYSIATDRLMYETEETFDQTINTFEAWINLPSTLADSIVGGVILGNYYNEPFGYAGCVNFGVGTKGNFYLYWNNGAYTHTFETVDLRNDTWTHVAIVRDDEAGKLYYYVNGLLEEEVDVVLGESVCQMRFGVGTDWNNWYDEKTPFYGKIEQVTVYSQPQSADVIKEDMTKKVITSDERNGLMSNWYFGRLWNLENKKVADTSDNANDCNLGTWDKYVAVEEWEDFDYTFMAVPDMQTMNYFKKENFFQQSQWIVDTKDKLNTQFVMYLGDMTEHRYSKDPQLSIAEWETASACLTMLDGKVPYTFVPGNHDYDNWGTESRATTNLNKYFSYDKYSKLSYFGGAFKEGYVENTYYLFNVGDVEYMVFALEYAPRTNVMNWVDRMITEHPNARVIITTHCYEDADGTIINVGDKNNPTKTMSYDSSNCGEQMWDKVLRKHANVFMVFSGHLNSDYLARHQDVGVHGNKVTSVLVDVQGSMMTSCMNTLLVIKVNERTKTMRFCYYSPEYDACYNMQNQFTMSFADENNPAVGLAEEVVQQTKTTQDKQQSAKAQGAIGMSFAGVAVMCATVKSKRKEA